MRKPRFPSTLKKVAVAFRPPGADQEHWRSTDGLLPHGVGQRHAVHAAAEPGPRHYRAVRLPPGGQARDPVGGRGHHLRVRGGGAHPAALLAPQVQVGRRRSRGLGHFIFDLRFLSLLLKLSFRFKSSPVNAIFCQALAGSPLRPHSLVQLDKEKEEQLKPPFSSATDSREVKISAL